MKKKTSDKYPKSIEKPLAVIAEQHGTTRERVIETIVVDWLAHLKAELEIFGDKIISEVYPFEFFNESMPQGAESGSLFDHLYDQYALEFMTNKKLQALAKPQKAKMTFHWEADV